MEVKRNRYACEPLILEWCTTYATESLVGIETSVTHNRNLQLRKQVKTSINNRKQTRQEFNQREYPLYPVLKWIL